MSWGPVYSGSYPAAPMRQVQLQLQELYHQQHHNGDSPRAISSVSAKAAQQFAVHFTPRQTRSVMSPPSKGSSGHLRSPSSKPETRISPSRPQPALTLSSFTSPVHLQAPHSPQLIQPSSYNDQAPDSRDRGLQMVHSRSLLMRLSDLPSLSSLWSDSAASQTLAYLHQILLKEYEIPARNLTVVHYQRLFDGYFEELKRDVQRGEDRMWVMGMALEENERTVARERAESGAKRGAEGMELDVVQDLEGGLRGTVAIGDMEYISSPISSRVILEMEERVRMNSETPQALNALCEDTDPVS